jgi:hypothetical protein
MGLATVSCDISIDTSTPRLLGPVRAASDVGDAASPPDAVDPIDRGASVDDPCDKSNRSVGGKPTRDAELAQTDRLVVCGTIRS